MIANTTEDSTVNVVHTRDNLPVVRNDLLIVRGTNGKLIEGNVVSVDSNTAVIQTYNEKYEVVFVTIQFSNICSHMTKTQDKKSWQCAIDHTMCTDDELEEFIMH